MPARLSAAAATASVTPPASRPWTVASLDRLLSRPLTAGCEAVAMTEGIRPGPADAIRASARLLGEGADFRDRYGEVSIQQIQRLFCPEDDCAEQGQLPEALGLALASVLFRAHTAVEVELDRRTYMGVRDAAGWAVHGGDGLLASRDGTGFNPSFGPDFEYLTASRIEQYEAAAALVQALTEVDWTPFADQRDVDWRWDTPWGPVVVTGGEDHTHRFEVAPLLLVDLGGNDTYLGREGSTGEERPVAVVVDLGGRDHHGYIDAVDTSTNSALPVDAAGRLTHDRFVGASASMESRQGGARTGIALWLDLGSDDDVYVALRASQGYAHHGVGVLIDAGGDDVYRVEAAGQGTAQFGIGLLMDLGRGADRYLAEHTAQGHGYTAGVGILYDDGGADRYVCVPHGTRYPAPQLDGAQVSLCQGAGFGLRSADPGSVLPGGIGLLFDQAGDDRYEAGVYGQGVGVSEGVGVLVDGAGRDVYDLVWHGQGAGVHAGVGVLRDRGVDDDRYGATGWGQNVMLGAGHDRAVGLFIDEGGDDEYQLASLTAGAATCGSVGLFADEQGDDRYLGSARWSLGRISADACAPGVAVMVDAGGSDLYPLGARAADNVVWDDGQGGLGIDDRGVSGLAESPASR